jgi:uncharacterized protein
VRTPPGVIIIILVMLLVDTYVFQAVRMICSTTSPKVRAIVYTVFWSISILAVICFLIFVYTSPEFLPKKIRTYLFATLIALFFSKAIAVIFFLIDDVRRLIQWLAGKFLFGNTEVEISADGISRSTFLTWLGLAAGGGLFSTLIYGFSNKYNYQVKRIKLSFPNLPVVFKGLRILHISDIHTGSFTNKSAVERGVKKILNENADIILFTGDLVNNKATEMIDYMDVFNKLKAPMGVYSTLGNHDYGDYVPWPNEGVTRKQNMDHLKKIHAELGWRLLMNEHVAIEKEGQKIALMGVENWSAKARFPKHGDLALAYIGSEQYPFKILMSHDPSHWDAEVRTKYPDIDLTLSGHTHGMQFGLEIPGIHWSPVQYVYKQWAGLYEEANQKLYVNRGFGFIGYPGRVGILPEITVIELG